MVFGYYIFFENETFLNHKNFKILEECDKVIYVYEDQHLSLSNTFDLKSEMFMLSGQKIYYYSQKYFDIVNKNSSWALEIKDVLCLLWDGKKQEIIYKKNIYYTPERLRFWVYHTFLPLVLELRKIYHILHVGSVEIEGKPILFSALSYGGKSTLTNYFLQQGHLLLSDDSLAIEKREDGYYAVPSYPYHRPYREVETLGYYTDHFFKKIKKVHHMYVLEKVDAKGEITIEEVKGIEKFKAFHYSSFIDFSFMKARRLAFFSGMSQQVCVYKISIPWDMERLPEVYEAICTHQQKI